GIVLAGFAPAVASPVAEAVNQRLQQRLVRHDGAALAHRNVVRGIEAYRGDVAEAPDAPSLPGRSQRVATVFHEPEFMLAAKGSDRVKIEDIPQRMRDHHGLHLRAVRGFELRYVD